MEKVVDKVEVVGEVVEEVMDRGEVVEEGVDGERWWKKSWRGERCWKRSWTGERSWCMVVQRQLVGEVVVVVQERVEVENLLNRVLSHGSLLIQGRTPFLPHFLSAWTYRDEGGESSAATISFCKLATTQCHRI